MRRAAARLGLLTVVAVAVGYLVQRPQSVPLKGPLAAAALEGFHAPEGAHRWSTGHATVRFRDPGPGVAFRVELDVSGWRPRGQETARVTLAAGGVRRPVPLRSRAQSVGVEASSSAWWRADVVVALDSDTFRPGPSDPRLLGARVHAARLVPLEGVLGLRRPPLGQAAAAAVAVVMLSLALAWLGMPARRAELLSAGAAVALGVAFALARPWAVLISWPLALAAAAAAAAARLAPGLLRAGARLVAETARAAGRGLRVLRAWPTAALVVGAVLAVAAAYRAQPRLAIDLGSGEEAAVASRFGASDRAAGATFRHPLRGAQLDLRDFGGGRPWTIWLTASTEGPPGSVVLARAGTAELAAPLDGRWATTVFRAHAPWGWRAGLSVTFPWERGAAAVRVDRVEVDRRGSFPSLRVVAAVVAASLLLVIAAGAAGLPALAAHVAGGLAAAGQAGALAAAPVASIPFAVSFAGICALAALLAAVLAAWPRARRPAEGSASATAAVPLPATALFAAAAGFAAWLSAALFPLYRGGHFVFHSQIAEEIWRGRFLLFYLPYPGSILSRQDQWGSIIVPHPCLFHTVISPLAALPRHWFHATEKALLALGLATLVLVAARLAQRLEGNAAAAGAAVLFATLVPTFQVLGLGHTMMLFGVWAASLAFAFVVLRFERLPQSATWVPAVAVLTVCFLSYTASLLFTSMALAAAAALLLRRAPAPARALCYALVAASVLAFGLYYVNWAGPFLTESLPQIASRSSAGAGESGEIWSRLALQPRKLSYTFGTFLLPLLGLGGLVAARRDSTAARVILLCWAAVLVLFSGLDLSFNFLRKHHYFVMVPVAVGGGVLLARLAARGRAGRAAAAALCAGSAALALRMAVDVALGRIP